MRFAFSAARWCTFQMESAEHPHPPVLALALNVPHLIARWVAQVQRLRYVCAETQRRGAESTSSSGHHLAAPNKPAAPNESAIRVG